jgi:hypothetical protein
MNCTTRSRGARLGLAILSVAVISSQAPAALIYGLANQGDSQFLLRWDSVSPTAISSQVLTPIGGFDFDTLVSLDFRPSNGNLYAFTPDRTVLPINRTNGRVGGDSEFGFGTPALNGFNFGMDFNPVVDRLRLISESNQNLVVTPGSFPAAVSPDVFYASGDPNVGVDPNIVHVAYTNNFAGATSTTLYGIDTNLDILVQIATATGALTTVGPLGVDVSAAGGFDISGTTGAAYAALLPTNSSASRFYTINLATGAATSVGQIDGGIVVTAMTVWVPEPGAAAILLGLCAALPLARKR